VQVFELYNSTNGLAETHHEMTDEEADLRNEYLREKQDSRRWVICDGLDEYPLPALSKGIRIG
jgi:hypothetical protein